MGIITFHHNQPKVGVMTIDQWIELIKLINSFLSHHISNPNGSNDILHDIINLSNSEVVRSSVSQLSKVRIKHKINLIISRVFWPVNTSDYPIISPYSFLDHQKKEELTTRIIRIQIHNEANPHPAHQLGDLEVCFRSTIPIREWIRRNDSVVTNTLCVCKYERNFSKMTNTDGSINSCWEDVEIVTVLCDVVLGEVA